MLIKRTARARVHSINVSLSPEETPRSFPSGGASGLDSNSIPVCARIRRDSNASRQTIRDTVTGDRYPMIGAQDLGISAQIFWSTTCLRDLSGAAPYFARKTEAAYGVPSDEASITFRDNRGLN